MSLETTPRAGQLVQDDFVQMEEGQAMGVRVVGLKKGRERPDWSIEARSENVSIVRVQPVADQDKKEDGELFVISAPGSGLTQIRFRLDGRHDVFVDANIIERVEWEPTVPPANFGGAGPD